VKTVSIIEEYIQYLAGSRHRSPNTIASYQNDLRHYCDYLNRPSNNPFETSGLSVLAELDLPGRIFEATPQTASAFCDFLKSKFYAPATMARKCAAVEGLYKYLLKTGHVKQNPFKNYKFAKPKRGGRLCMEESGALKLLGSIGNHNWLGVRDKAFVILLYTTGIKVGELLRLTPSDYSADEKVLSIHKPGGKTRSLSVPELAAPILDDYILVRCQKSKTCDPPTELLFLNRDCSPISVRSIRRKLKEYGKKAGLPFHITPEVLRRSHAVKMLGKGVPIEQLARQMGYLSVAAFKQQMELNESHQMKDEV
jgi:site-specific recombinase XerD